MSIGSASAIYSVNCLPVRRRESLETISSGRIKRKGSEHPSARGAHGIHLYSFDWSFLDSDLAISLLAAPRSVLLIFAIANHMLYLFVPMSLAEGSIVASQTPHDVMYCSADGGEDFIQHISYIFET